MRPSPAVVTTYIFAVLYSSKPGSRTGSQTLGIGFVLHNF